LIAAGEGVSIVSAPMRHMQPQGLPIELSSATASGAVVPGPSQYNGPSTAVRNLAALARRAAGNIG